MNNYLLKNAHLYMNHTFLDVDILIEDGFIKQIDKNINSSYPTYDLKGKLVCHNFIDMHVHLREPGYEYKETIDTGSLSALYGGYGTICAMANTNPCMDDVETIKDFAQRVKKNGHVNIYTYSAITKDLKGQQLVDMDKNIQEDIVIGFSDDGKGVQSDMMMDSAMKKVAALDSIICAHCEDESELHGGCIHEGHYAKEHGLIGINNASEYKQVNRDINLVRKYHNRYHVCHISTKETVQLIRQAQSEGLQVSGEATPHHLILTEDNIKDCHPNYKMNPPVRSKEDHQAIIDGLNDGTISVISTDHAPHSKEEKMQHISKAPFGIIGSQHAFPLLYTYLVKKNLVSLDTIIDALTSGPAKVLGIDAHIKTNKQANLCIFDLDQSFTIKEEDIKSKACNTPFLGVTCYGKIYGNVLNGKLYLMEDHHE